MARKFDQRMDAILRVSGGNVMLLLRPLMSEMPAPMHFQDDPFFPFSKDIIRATRDVVCGYVFDFAAYMAHAGAGARALERALAYAGPDVLKVLHGPFVGGGYIPMVYENALGADAATLAREDDLAAYHADEAHGAFVVRGGPVDGAVRTPTYWEDVGLLQLADGRALPVAGTDVLYCDYTDAYAAKVREALERWRGG